ncbi:MAG TPA: class I SAM-dependent methyltransferase [Anaerolineaceae bacterium]|nr:class I SAM-dependent methyltransferase [Anaerolineaceae bacterium]HPN52320.1 class I SAM-dependent methyltransferase [Anaerolineaceae bacterium]
MTLNEFPPDEFDAWAESYDESVRTGCGFPFDGYEDVLQTAACLADVAPGDAVLDLGAGTGNLAVLLAAQGARLWCLDFSAEMLAKAREKLPEANFARSDLRAGWPPAFQRRYTAIVSGYTFHHFPLEEKVAQIRRLFEQHLQPGGRLVIADITFPDAAAQEACAHQLGSEWEPEYYWLADEALRAFKEAGWQAEYTQVSPCAAVFKITP